LLVPISAADRTHIVNAIQDAVGARIRELPITPERVLKAIHEMQEHHINLMHQYSVDEAGPTL
jgi:hypothetical protein